MEFTCFVQNDLADVDVLSFVWQSLPTAPSSYLLRLLLQSSLCLKLSQPHALLVSGRPTQMVHVLQMPHWQRLSVGMVFMIYKAPRGLGILQTAVHMSLQRVLSPPCPSGAVFLFCRSGVPAGSSLFGCHLALLFLLLRLSGLPWCGG